MCELERPWTLQKCMEAFLLKQRKTLTKSKTVVDQRRESRIPLIGPSGDSSFVRVIRILDIGHQIKGKNSSFPGSELIGFYCMQFEHAHHIPAKSVSIQNILPLYHNWGTETFPLSPIHLICDCIYAFHLKNDKHFC